MSEIKHSLAHQEELLVKVLDLLSEFQQEVEEALYRVEELKAKLENDLLRIKETYSLL